jgi:hypothetical protein
VHLVLVVVRILVDMLLLVPALVGQADVFDGRAFLVLEERVHEALGFFAVGGDEGGFAAAGFFFFEGYLWGCVVNMVCMYRKVKLN